MNFEKWCCYHLTCLHFALVHGIEIGILANMSWLLVDQNKLTGSIPSELGLLSNLTHIYFDKNNMDGALPSEMGMLTLMEELQIHNNAFRGPIPSELGLMAKGLRILYLQHNVSQLRVPIKKYISSFCMPATSNSRSNVFSIDVDAVLGSS